MGRSERARGSSKPTAVKEIKKVIKTPPHSPLAAYLLIYFQLSFLILEDGVVMIIIAF